MLVALWMSSPAGIAQSGDDMGAPFGLRIALTNGQPRLQWPSVGGQGYEVDARGSLGEGGWSHAVMVTAPDPTATWIDPTPLSGSRFYRVAYPVPKIVVSVMLTHASQSNGIPNLATGPFASVRERLSQMASAGAVILPVPVPDLASFDTLQLSESTVQVDDLQRTLVVLGKAALLGKPVDLMFIGAWADDTNAAAGFSLGVKFAEMHLTDWVSDLSGTVLDELKLENSILTLATVSLNLDLSRFAGNVAGFYGGSTLELRHGLNIHSQTDLVRAPGLAAPLHWLGFTDTIVRLEGYLGVDPDALFHPTAPSAARLLHLRAHLPVSQPAGFPTWLKPKQRILEFTNDPTLRVRLLDILEANPDGQRTRFLASTEFAPGGGQTSVTLSGSALHPWTHPFGIRWLVFEQAALTIAFSDAGAGHVRLSGDIAAGDQTISADLTLTETGTGKTASFVATVDQITLGNVLQLASNLSGPEPFGADLDGDALVLSNATFSFSSTDERSLTVSGSTIIRDAIQADFLLSFVEAEGGTSMLVAGLRVHDFKLSALYAGIDATLAGHLEFPGVAFTIVQDLPGPPEEPIQIPSRSLNALALDFYEPILGTPPFVLAVKAGVNFNGMFTQSALPPVVGDAFGMDPDGKVLLEGALSLRFGALAGGDPVILDSLNLKATLPPPTRARVGFPEWLADLHPGPRTLEFNYEDPDTEVNITEVFEVNLDGEWRTFVTSATLATGDQPATLTLTGYMIGGWVKPFGIDWLTLDTVGVHIAADGTNVTAALHSSFGLGDKNVALELDIAGGSSNRLVRFNGTVDTLSLSDFLDLARNQLGADAEPFGDSGLDFTFSNVRLSIETGTRSSFSLGGDTSLNGTAARVLFSVLPSPGGGLPQIITGFQMQDWSLASALDEVKGTFVEDFRLQTVALVFSKGEGTTASADMDPETRAFYGNICGTGEFSVPFRNGLSLIGVVPLGNHPLQGGLGALGMSTDSIFLAGTLPGSILGLGGGGGGLSGLGLVASLPPMSPPGSPAWFVSGQLGLEITAQPSVGFIGSITVNIEDEILTFDISAAIQRVGASVEFALTGGLSAQEPWVEPFGIEWLIFNNATVKVAVSAIGSITLGFAGDMVVGEKDIDVAVAVSISPAGVPTNFIFDGATEQGVSMTDLVMLQQRMAQVNDPAAPIIPLDVLPQMAVRNLHLKFAPRGDPDLGVEAGFAVAGNLWIPSEANGPPDRNFAGVNLSVDLSGILAHGHLGAFVLGPIRWVDATCDLTLTLPVQHLLVSGAAEVRSLFQGDLELRMTKSGFSFLTTTTIFSQFQAQLDASASFSLDAPHFTVRGQLQDDFSAAIVPALTQELKNLANGSTAVANNLLERGLVGWSGFRDDPHRLDFASRVSGFASAAGWPQGEWSTYISAIQDAMEQIDGGSPVTPPDLLDLALGGYTTPGIPGVKTTVCVRRRLVPPFDCLEYQEFCNGVPYGGGPCWTVPPATIGGVCHRPDLAVHNIPCSSTPFIEQKLIPPLVSRMDAILQNGNRSPMIVIEQAEFASALNGLASSPVVNLAMRVRFMQAATRLNLSSTWDFDDQGGSLSALRDALVNAL
jgi:hypothetical protein